VSIARIMRAWIGDGAYPHGGIGGHGGIFGLDEGLGVDPTALHTVGEVGKTEAAVMLPEGISAHHTHPVKEVGHGENPFHINGLPTRPTHPTGCEPDAGAIEDVATATAAHEPVGDVDREVALEVAKLRKQWSFVYRTAMKGGQGRASAMRAAYQSCVAFWLEAHPGATADEGLRVDSW
jgi:hypothetical protein